MQVINMKVEEWLQLFYELQLVKEKLGSSIIFDALKKANIVTCILKKYHFEDFEIICFLEVVKNIYSYENIIRKIEQAIEELKITHIAFIVDGLDKSKVLMNSVDTKIWTSFNQYQVAIPIDDKKTKTIIYSNREFFVIEEKITLYTCDFRLIINQFIEEKKNQLILKRDK